jgi:hypothetical protein
VVSLRLVYDHGTSSRFLLHPFGFATKIHAVINLLSRLLEPYGAPERVVDLREKTPAGIPYLDLLQGDRRALPDGVVETGMEPLAYVVDRASRSAEIDLPRLRKTVTLRGDAPYLVIVEPGRLVVYDTSSPKKELPPFEEVASGEDRARLTFPRLNAALSVPDKAGRLVHDGLFKLLDKAICELEPAVGRDDAIALTGRALFVRFLIDRDIVTTEHLKEICPTASGLTELFTGPERTLATCQWLNATFNGDFLPLSPSAAASIRANAPAPLENVMHRSPGGQLRFDWASIDFAHVPVGLLSQIYERQAEMWDPAGKRRQGVYYTPRRIADYMVREVFAALEDQGPVAPHAARVLDPAVGGGVFLVAAFQEIVAAWWQHHRRPPDTGEIRSILYEQLTGFDISEPALQLAALSLYLKAIELDLDPHPPAKLRFRALRGKVLHSMREPGEEQDEVVLGSLGPRANGLHRHRYDVVIGNPPWTPIERKWAKVHSGMVDTARRIVAERLGQEREATFSIPDSVPDLPFVWRAMDWAKPSGWIALALHGRLLFKASEGGRNARRALFEAIQVTGVLNGTDLRETQVWPRVRAPFCLLFARNRLPESDHAFHFASPSLEEPLNRQGRLRIDAEAAYPVELRRLVARPELFKILFRGTALDADLLEKLQSEWPTLAQYFQERGLTEPSEGYQDIRGKNDAKELLDLPNLTAATAVGAGRFLLRAEALPLFEKPRLHRPRQRGIYRAPLVIVRELVSADRRAGQAVCSLVDVAYTESFYGCSTHGHPAAPTLARYLSLLLNSELFRWHVLLTSSKLGIERDALLKEDVGRMPFRPLEDLPEILKSEIRHLSTELFADSSNLLAEVDSWVARVYGLNRWDREVIRDTLAVAIPFPEIRRNAQRPPEIAEIKKYTARLEGELQPFVQAAGKRLEVKHLTKMSFAAPWEVLLLTTSQQKEPPESTVLDELFRRADRAGASQIRLIQPDRGRLLLGILREYRYWTQTRARLTALELLKEHLGELLRRS